MKTHSKSYLQKKQDVLIERFKKMEFHVLRGSLIERYKRCGKPGCKCAKGKGHGPKFYLSVSFPGRQPEMIYVPLAHKHQIEKYLENFQTIKQLLESICEINRELLKRKELI